METIRGRRSLALDLTELNERITNYQRLILDLGTGDGKFAFHLANNFPRHFVIGMDACRENLREYSRAKLPNLLFVAANAQALPCELNGLVSHLVINFPWGSLLEGLLSGDLALMRGLACISGPAASVDLRLNGGALAEAGWTLEDGTEQIRGNLIDTGWKIGRPVTIGAGALRNFPSTWAKRLAFGRDSRAVTMNGCFSG